MYNPVIKVYDTISPTDMQPHLLMRFSVDGTFGKGVFIIINKDGQEISFECVDGDTPQTVAAKIAAAWNSVYPTQGNTVAPANSIAGWDSIVQLVSKPYEYTPFSIRAEYREPTVQETVVEAIEETVKKKNNLLLLGAGGLLLFFLLRKKKKGAK